MNGGGAREQGKNFKGGIMRRALASIHYREAYSVFSDRLGTESAESNGGDGLLFGPRGQRRFAELFSINLLIHLKDTFFDTAVGTSPNLARMCG